MRKFLPFFLTLVLVGSVCAASFMDNDATGDMIIKIHIQDKNLALLKLNPLHLGIEDVGDTWIRAAVNPKQLDEIQALGYKVDVLYEDSRLRADERRTAMGERWIGWTAAVNQMTQAATDHSAICVMHNIGTSVQGRTIYAMEITDNPGVDEPDEAEVRIVGNIHGDEFMSYEIMLLLMDYLTDNYGTDPTVTDLVDNREIWIQVSVNPDGHENGTRSNANGVDMNRNHGYMYDYSSGSGPFSEIELHHFREYSLDRNFSMSLTFHGVTHYFNYCWNFTYEDAFDKTYLDYLGDEYTSLPVGNPNNYIVTEGADWYPTNGDTNDWSYGCRGSFDVTIETDGNSEGAITADWNYNRDAILYIIDQAAYGLSGVVTDSVTGQELSAQVLVHQHPMPVFTDPVAGDYHRPLQTGTYDITVWSNGYAPTTINGLHVTSGAITTRDVQLVPNYEYYVSQVAWNVIDSYYSSNNSTWPEMWPHKALGPPDGEPGSLGVDCEVAYDMGEGFEINDISGTDFIVYEAAVDSDESCTVYGSSDGFLGPWVNLGIATGTTEFDLSGSGLSTVRYIRLVDDGDGTSSGTYPGYDLDAIGMVLPVEGCGLISLNDTIYTCDDQTVTITVVDSDLNTNPTGQETEDVIIYSDTNPTGEVVTVTEDSVDSDTFTGTILLSETTSGGGYLIVDLGDTITAVYSDVDCEGTPQIVTDTAYADCADPVLAYESYLIDDAGGDGDGVLDPDETVFMSVTLGNTGNEAATGVYAEITTSHPTYITVYDDTATYPAISAGSSASSNSPHFSIGASASTPDHTIITVYVTMYSDDSVNTGEFQMDVTSSTYAQRYVWNMDTDPGWTTEGQWEHGVPLGNDGDPSSGYTGANVYGYNLAGEYTNYLSETNLTSTAIDCSNLTAVEVQFMRWLGVEDSQYDHATFELSNNGTTWTVLYENPDTSFTDSTWQTMTYDISAVADGQATVYLRWVMGSTDVSVTYCGWNIDDVEIWAEALPAPTPTPSSCPHHGDVNFSGDLTAGDAQLTFWIAMGTYTPTPEEECAADCNNTGNVTAGDAQAVFEAALGVGSCADPI